MDPRQTANDIMDEACLPEALVANGVDRAIRDRIVLALEQMYGRAHEGGRQHGREELQCSLRHLLNLTR